MVDVVSFYERPGLNVETYDARMSLAATAVEGDVEFYIAQAREAEGPVLEVACGTGRVTWPLAEAGCEVVGIDRSPAMLAAARARGADRAADVARRARFEIADMVDFDLDAFFSIVLVPFRAFQAVLDPADQRRALESMSDHLRPGGRLIVDLFDPLLEFCLPEGDRAPRQRGEVVHPESGRRVTVDVLERTNDPVAQVLTELWCFREYEADGRVGREEHEELRLRWTYRQEMRYLLELVGFEVVAEHSDFRGSPPTYGAEQVWIAVKS